MLSLCFTMMASVAPLTSAAATGQMEGWWRFAEVQGDVAKDSSGKERDAVVDTNRVERIGDAPGGGSLCFGGVAAPSSSGAARS